MTYWHDLARRFESDRGGAIAMLFAFSVFTMLFGAGLALDASRAYSVAAKTASALDAAALSAAKYMDQLNPSDGEITARAQAVFRAHTQNMPVPGVTFENFRARPNRAEHSVSIDVDVVMPTAFAQIAGVSHFDILKSATAIYQSKRIELVLVLDITGSMCEPYAQPCTSAPKLDGLKDAAKDLIQSLASSNNEPAAIRIGLAPYSASLNAGGYYGAVTGSIGGDGCVVERAGSAAYTDAAPGMGSNLATSSTAENAAYSCPSSSAVPMRDMAIGTSKSSLVSAVNGLSGFGGTAGHIGLAWGWYMLSPLWNSIWPTESRPANPGPGVVKAIVLMTDGMFNTSYKNGNTNSADPLAPGSSPNQASQLCANIRAQDIEIYAVAFQSPPEAEALLRSCAGKSANFYNSDNTSQLRSSFRDIADKLSSLRLKS